MVIQFFALAGLLAAIAPMTAPSVAPEGVPVGSMPGSTNWESILMVAASGSRTGTASLQNTKAGILVTIHLNNAKGRQVAEIDRGTCAKRTALRYRLQDVVDGTSVTTIKGMTIGALFGPNAIDVRASSSSRSDASCGDIAAAQP